MKKRKVYSNWYEEYMSDFWKSWEKLGKGIKDTTVVVTVSTPAGWKCKKKGCTTKFKHKHSTFTCLMN